LKWTTHNAGDRDGVRLVIFSDSMLVVKWTLGKWKCRVLHIQELRDETLSLLSKFSSWTITWKPRKTNVERFGH